jgi:transposase
MVAKGDSHERGAMGAAVAITRTEHTAAGLRALAGRCRDGAQVRRLLALAMVLDGCGRTKAAARNGMERRTLRDWVHRHNEAGTDGLRSRRSPGPTPLLAAAQRAELRALVIQGPGLATHKVVRWRCLDLREEVARRFDVTVHESTIGTWLRQLDLTRLQPRPFHPKKDAGAEGAFNLNPAVR